MRDLSTRKSAYFPEKMQALDAQKPARVAGFWKILCDRTKRVLGGLGGLMDTQHEPFSARSRG
jgi:hypothetical protein